MNFLKKCVLIVMPTVSFIITVLTFIHFTIFMSDFFNPINFNLTTLSKEETIVEGSFIGSDIDPFSGVTQALVVDYALLSLFIIQHSSLLWPIHDILSISMGLPVLSRTLFNIFTALSLQLLMSFWKPIPQYCLWTIDYEEQTRQFQIIVGVHLVGWVIIYNMTITMDLTDLFGIKQVYFHATGRSISMLQSQRLQTLHKKMIHPSLLGFTLIFWMYPSMRLDRLLLASVWSLYMLLAWRPDTLVNNYVVQQQVLKKTEIPNCTTDWETLSYTIQYTFRKC